MNELELYKFNKSITFEEGKIYWKENEDYSSKLWERLKTQGYRMERIRGFVSIYDNNNYKIVDTIGIVHALKQLAEIMV